jgi:hypothetical protein
VRDPFITSRALIDLIGKPLLLVPDSWEELPFPKSTRVALGLAVDNLPALLRNAAAAVSDVPDLDDEVAHFTQVSGWQKIDNLLPLLYYRLDGFLPWYWRLERWIESLRRYADELKASAPPSLGGGN